VKQAAQALTALGYVAIATDMYGGGAFHDDPDAAGKALMTVMEPLGLLRTRCVAWFEAVRALPQVDPARIAAIGYCFGGQCVLELARSGADVKAVVSYHGLLTTAQPAETGAVKGEVVAYCGAQDPYAPPDHVAALRAELENAGTRHQITIFSEAAHGFTDPDAAKTGRPGIAYHAQSDRISWAGTLALLEMQIGRRV
jgi:dienelactone hydrolase